MDSVSDEDLVGFTDAPTQEESRELTDLASEFFKTDSEIDALKNQIESLTERKTELATKILPDYLMKIKQDRVGLPMYDVDIVLEDFVHANIATDWEEERREEAFAWLEKSGNGDLIKTVVTASFPRRALSAARWLVTAIETALEYFKKAGGDPVDLPEMSIGMAVPWNTLTAFAKEQLAKGAELPLDVLGVKVGKIVKIKKRDTKKLKKRS